MMMAVITDDYDDYDIPDVEPKTVVRPSRRRGSGGSQKKRVFVPVFVPEKQKKKSKLQLYTRSGKSANVYQAASNALDADYCGTCARSAVCQFGMHLYALQKG